MSEIDHYSSKSGDKRETIMKMEQDTILNLDFPFDLNNLFNMNYSFETLKEAIEFLAKQ